jgi:hypothetical protein
MKMSAIAVPDQLTVSAWQGPTQREIQTKRLNCGGNSARGARAQAELPQVMYNFWQGIPLFSWLKKQR